MIRRVILPVFVLTWLIIATLIGLALGIGYRLPPTSPILYSKDYWGEGDYPYPHQAIYLRDLSHNLEALLTNRYGYNYALNWSPDGQQIAYLSFDGQQSEIYLMNALGQHKRQISLEYGYFSIPTPTTPNFLWSPDSQRIIYTIKTLTELKTILFDTVTDKSYTFPEALNPGLATWSPDSKHLIYQRFIDSRSTHLYVMNSECFTESRPCEFNELAFLQNQYSNGNPLVWSPDRQSIAFTNKFKHVVVAKLRCADLIESCIEHYNIIGHYLYINPLHWSPDSQQLEFLPDLSQIEIIRPKTNEQRLFVAEGRYGENWSPDSRFIIYVSDWHFYKSIIYVLDTITGQTYTQYGGSITSPVQWRPNPH